MPSVITGGRTLFWPAQPESAAFEHLHLSIRDFFPLSGGTAVITSLVDGLSVELATALVVAVMFTYTYIGCLGATFYVSYFNTSIIFTIMLVFLVKVYHAEGSRNPLGK